MSATATYGLHPRNSGFEWLHRQPPYRLLDEAQVRQFDAQGFFLLRGALDPAEVREVAEAADPFEQKMEDWLRAQEAEGSEHFISKADRISFTIHLVKLSERIRRFSLHPVFRDLALDLLGEGARLYWDQAVYKKPGNPEEFPWHQDNGYTFVEPQQYLTCWVPLVDVIVENGCPWVAPGYHREGTLKHVLQPLGLECLREPAGTVPVEARVGDVVVFSSLTPHRTGPNLTDQVRKAYILQYSQAGAFLIDEESGAHIPQNDPDRQYLVAESGA